MGDKTLRLNKGKAAAEREARANEEFKQKQQATNRAYAQGQTGGVKTIGTQGAPNIKIGQTRLTGQGRAQIKNMFSSVRHVEVRRRRVVHLP